MLSHGPTKRRFRKRTIDEFEQFVATRDRLDFGPRESSPKLSVIIVLFNQADLTLRCLRSVQAQAGVSMEIILVDNASTDRTDELLARVDGASIIRHEKNLGFLRAVNESALSAKGEMLLLLNNDAMPMRGAFIRGVTRLSGDKTIGAVGARITRPSGRLQEAGPIVWRNASGIGFGAGRTPDLSQFRIPRDIDYCCGAFMLTTKELFRRLGGFDERYAPAYYEEMDFCFRLREAGFRCFYDPSISVIHYGRASAPSLLWPYKQMLRNRGKFCDRHGVALAGRLAPNPRNYWRALRGRPPSPWILVLTGAMGAQGKSETIPSTVRLSNALLNLGCFVTVFSFGDTPELSAPFFGHTDAPDTGSIQSSAPRDALQDDATSHFDAIIVLGPDAGETLCDTLRMRGVRSPGPAIVIDRPSFETTAAVSRLRDKLLGQGIEHVEIADTLALVAMPSIRSTFFATRN